MSYHGKGRDETQSASDLHTSVLATAVDSRRGSNEEPKVGLQHEQQRRTSPSEDRLDAIPLDPVAETKQRQWAVIPQICLA